MPLGGYRGTVSHTEPAYSLYIDHRLSQCPRTLTCKLQPSSLTHHWSAI